MIIILKRDVKPHYWMLESESGNRITDPQLFKDVHEATDWAERFISSWPTAHLVVKE